MLSERLILFFGKMQRRAKLNVAAPTIPMELRVEKALEGIYACCFRRGVIEEEDEERSEERRVGKSVLLGV